MEFCNFASVIVPLATNAVNQIMIAMDAGNEDAFAGQFTETGTCHVIVMDRTFEGTSELKGLCKTLHTKFKGVRHWEGNVCITQEEDGLTNTSYWKAMNGGECVSTGMHKDILECDGETCKIISRTIIHFWTKAGGHITSAPPAPPASPALAAVDQ